MLSVFTAPVAAYGIEVHQLRPGPFAAAVDGVTRAGCFTFGTRHPAALDDLRALHEGQRKGDEALRRWRLFGRPAEERGQERNSIYLACDLGILGRVQGATDPQRAYGVAHQRHLVVSGVRACDRIVDRLGDIANPHIGVRESHIAGMRVTMSAKRIGSKQGALLIERKYRIVGSVAPLRAGVDTVRREGRQARVAGSSSPRANLVERPYPSRLGANVSIPTRAKSSCTLRVPPPGAAYRRSKATAAV